MPNCGNPKYDMFKECMLQSYFGGKPFEDSPMANGDAFEKS